MSARRSLQRGKKHRCIVTTCMAKHDWDAPLVVSQSYSTFPWNKPPTGGGVTLIPTVSHPFNEALGSFKRYSSGRLLPPETDACLHDRLQLRRSNGQ